MAAFLFIMTKFADYIILSEVTHNKIASYINMALIAAGVALSVSLGSCNAKDDEDSSGGAYVSTESVAITAFSLNPDMRVMPHLDSVFFSIDLEHAVVYNADSLPKGTRVVKLIPKISYPSSVTSATIEMTGGTHREGTVDYIAHPNDTIDFTGNVTLTLGADDNKIKKTYTLKVNVHNADPDTIIWNQEGSMPLPSRASKPKAQKSTVCGGKVVTMIEESDGTYTLAETSDIFGGVWTSKQVSLGFTPRIDSFSAAEDGTLYMLASNGDLMSSTTGNSWARISTGWDMVIGWYGDALLGSSEGKMCSWPAQAVSPIALPDNFPESGFSKPIEFNNRWSSEPTIVIFGGLCPDGTLSTASWAFDGSSWANIADSPLPALEGVAVVNYYSFLNSSSNGQLKEFNAYLAFGGRDKAGNINTTTFVTYDNGISWQRARKYMQLPETVTVGYSADALTIGTSMSSNLSNRWKARRHLPFEIDGDLILWECPYIFLFGGYDANYSLNPEIRSGVLQRLTFAPLF